MWSHVSHPFELTANNLVRRNSDCREKKVTSFQNGTKKQEGNHDTRDTFESVYHNWFSWRNISGYRTWEVKQLGKNHFEKFIHINFVGYTGIKKRQLECLSEGHSLHYNTQKDNSHESYLAC